MKLNLNETTLYVKENLNDHERAVKTQALNVCLLMAEQPLESRKATMFSFLLNLLNDDDIDALMYLSIEELMTYILEIDGEEE